MRLKVWVICTFLLVLMPCAIFAQTRKPLTNDDIVSMTKQGFEAPLIVKKIQAGDNNFNLSAQALVDLKNAGVTVVVQRDSHARATVSHVKKAGMMGKGGELNVQMQYLVTGDNRVRLRGTKGREGENKEGATIVLTLLFGPIGLIKHGKNVDIPAGTPLIAYVDQDIWLPPIK